MKFHLGSWGVAAGALLSVALVGCDSPVEKKMEPPPANTAPNPAQVGSTPANYPPPAPETNKPAEIPTPAPTPETNKPAETPTPAPTPETKPGDKPTESTPAPKDESKKEEAPK